MKDIEAAAIAAGRPEEDLMAEAGAGVAAALSQLVPGCTRFLVLAGKGHNAGDAFVAARHLAEAGCEIFVHFATGPADLRPLAARQWHAVEDRVTVVTEATPCEHIVHGDPPVVLDGLLGIGSTLPLKGALLKACQQANALRQAYHLPVVAIDLPSGLDADTGRPDPHAIVADLTLTIGAVKKGLLSPKALDHVGRLALVPVAGLEEDADETADRLLTPEILRSFLPPPRPFDFHKGQAGRVTLVAGSRGLLGAARLSSAAAVRGGAGLVTLVVPENLYDIAAASCLPEVMVRPVADDAEAVASIPADAIAIGPGLGRERARPLLSLMADDLRPMILDADALNVLAENEPRRHLECPNGPRLLTPHPGEMARLLAATHPKLVGKPRADQARAFSESFPVTLLLKGARTLVAEKDQPLFHNATGHPGMASGGMGDVLTGLLAALVAQGVPTGPAACLGSWLLGRSAEIALACGASPESLCPSDVLDHLGDAFRAVRHERF